MSATKLGIPSMWTRVMSWLNFSGPTEKPEPQQKIERKLKCPEVDILQDYSRKPHKKFWESFPSYKMPTHPVTSVNFKVLAEKLTACSPLLLTSQLYRGYKVVHNLQHGAPSFQMKQLPSVFCENSKTSVEYGPDTTDTLAHWVKSKVLCGPFEQPPLRNFRVNSLLLIPQTDKIRPVLNVSLPKNRSFNDNIDMNKMEKVKMTSARRFSISILEAGRNAIMSKMDMRDAYKNVPAKICDLRLQGLSWLNMYFIECQQIFGAKTAVSNFDQMGNTVLAIALTSSRIQKKMVHRQLDDVIAVAPKDSGMCEEFTKNYKTTCKDLNIKLADDCVNKEKAFSNSTSGKVLGINFCTETLSWSLTTEKKFKVLNAIHDTLEKGSIDLLSCQKLVGRLVDVGQMNPFLACFKRNILDTLREAEKKQNEETMISEQTKKELLVWWAAINDKDIWLPIEENLENPTISHKSITTDAAGLPENSNVHGKLGAGGVVLDEDGRIIMAIQTWWNKDVLDSMKDSKGTRIGDKMSTLEFTAILIPFLCDPDMFKNQHVVVHVDNISCCYGWENGSVTEDELASILIRSLKVISFFLNCVIHVRHKPRESSWEIRFADRLTREKTTNEQDRRCLKSFEKYRTPAVLTNWLNNPQADWNLVNELLDYVMSTVHV